MKQMQDIHTFLGDEDSKIIVIEGEKKQILDHYLQTGNASHVKLQCL